MGLSGLFSEPTHRCPMQPQPHAGGRRARGPCAAGSPELSCVERLNRAALAQAHAAALIHNRSYPRWGAEHRGLSDLALGEEHERPSRRSPVSRLTARSDYDYETCTVGFGLEVLCEDMLTLDNKGDISIVGSSPGRPRGSPPHRETASSPVARGATRDSVATFTPFWSRINRFRSQQSSSGHLDVPSDAHRLGRGQPVNRAEDTSELVGSTPLPDLDGHARIRPRVPAGQPVAAI
jgi:hypothetical protein